MRYIHRRWKQQSTNGCHRVSTVLHSYSFFLAMCYRLKSANFIGESFTHIYICHARMVCDYFHPKKEPSADERTWHTRKC